MIARHIRRRIRRVGLALSAAAVASVVIGPFLIPVPPLKGVYPPETLGDPDSRFIEIDGRTTHVKVLGQGDPTFLLLHGFAASLYSWQAVMELLSRVGTVIAFDRIGFGLSSRPLTWSGQNPYSTEAQVSQVIALLDHFGGKQAILMGNSAGGTIAMNTALRHPERISGLILVAPAVYIGAEALTWLRPVLSTPQMRHLGPLITRQMLKYGQNIINFAWHDPSLLKPEIVELYKKSFQVEGWDQALWEFTLASHYSDLAKRLGEINLPCLVITGDDDRIVPTRDSIRLARELPDAHLVVIPKAGHVPHEERPTIFMEAVIEFVEKIKTGTRWVNSTQIHQE